MKSIIERGDGYTVASVGGGAAYELARESDGATAFVQYGDEAAAWRAEYDAMQVAHADPATVWGRQSWRECMAHLWEAAGGEA